MFYCCQVLEIQALLFRELNFSRKCGLVNLFLGRVLAQSLALLSHNQRFSLSYGWLWTVSWLTNTTAVLMIELGRFCSHTPIQLNQVYCVWS